MFSFSFSVFFYPFFWPKYAAAVSAAYITQDLYYEPFPALKTFTLLRDTPFGEPDSASPGTEMCPQRGAVVFAVSLVIAVAAMDCEIAPKHMKPLFEAF